MRTYTRFELKDHLAYVLATPVRKIGPWFYVTETSPDKIAATPKCTLVPSDAVLRIIEQERPTSLPQLTNAFALVCSEAHCDLIKTDQLAVKMILVGLLNEKRIDHEFVNQLVFG